MILLGLVTLCCIALRVVGLPERAIFWIMFPMLFVGLVATGGV